MKRLSIIIFMALGMTFSTYAQDDAVIPGEKNNSQNSELPKTTFLINPLGLLQFGPILSTEHKLGNTNGYIAPHFRWSYLGLLTHVLWGIDGGEVTPGSFAVGMGYKNFMLQDNNNAPYFGGGMEIIREHANYYDWGTEEFYLGYSIFANGGYRWRFETGRFLNVGLIAGVASTISDEEYYLDGTFYDSYSETNFVGMLELSFGWQKY